MRKRRLAGPGARRRSSGGSSSERAVPEVFTGQCWHITGPLGARKIPQWLRKLWELIPENWDGGQLAAMISWEKEGMVNFGAGVSGGALFLALYSGV